MEEREDYYYFHNRTGVSVRAGMGYLSHVVLGPDVEDMPYLTTSRVVKIRSALRFPVYTYIYILYTNTLPPCQPTLSYNPPKTPPAIQKSRVNKTNSIEQQIKKQEIQQNCGTGC